MIADAAQNGLICMAGTPEASSAASSAYACATPEPKASLELDKARNSCLMAGVVQAFRLADVTPEDLSLQAETLELINSEVTARLARQSDSAAKIDTKAALLVGYVIAAVSFLATQRVDPILAGFAYAAYALAAGLGISAYAVRSYRDVPDPRGLVNRYARLSKANALASLAAERVKAFEENAGKHSRKARQWWLSVAALLVGVTLMVLAIVVHNDVHGGPARPRPGATAVASHRSS